MEPDTKLLCALLAIFAVGLCLLAVGLGVNTKPAAIGVGLVLCAAAVSLLNGGLKR